jgi:geranylgeranyl reductase family protein
VKTDIAIIGGGPAGARAAYDLARRGARVVLFDPSHPREKPCGGGITGRAIALVADMLDAPARDAVAIRSARFMTRAHLDEPHPGSGPSRLRPGSVPGPSPRSPRSVAVPLDEHGLVVSSRRDFDGALLAAAVDAGAVHERVRVVDVSVGEAGVTITSARGRHRADFVVGADGPNSVVRRRVAVRFRRDQLSIATGFFASGVTSAEIVLELGSDPPGYIWSFPRPDHLAIGICAPAHSGVTAGVLRRMVARWIERTGIARGATLQPYSWPIPSLARSDLAALGVAGPRWCLVGDAAGLVDPITREGIFFALASGQWAAESLATIDATARYTDRVHDEALADLAHAARLQAAFFQPRFTDLVTRALSESAAIRRIMADLIAGQQPYATLKWRLLRTLELGLAWRSLRAPL